MERFLWALRRTLAPVAAQLSEEVFDLFGRHVAPARDFEVERLLGIDLRLGSSDDEPDATEEGLALLAVGQELAHILALAAAKARYELSTPRVGAGK